MSRYNLVTEMKALLGEEDADEAEAKVKTKKLVAALADEAYDRAAKWQVLKYGFQKLRVEQTLKGMSMLVTREKGAPLPFGVTVEFFSGAPHYELSDSNHKVKKLPLDTTPAEVIKQLWAMQLKILKASASKNEEVEEPLEEEEEEGSAATLTPDGKLPAGSELSNDDKRAALGVFNTKLAKLMQGLKKGAGATSIAQNYKGTGKQAFRRQLWIRFDSGAVIDLWLDNGFLKFGGVVKNSGPSGRPTPKTITYADKTPDDVFVLANKELKYWAS